MIIYLSQHGKCEDGDTSDERMLSNTGMRETRAVGERLKFTDCDVSRIIHSGKKRAEQTSKIFSEFVCAPLEASSCEMGPKADVKDFPSMLADKALYVGHLPYMEKLVSFLVTGSEDWKVIRFQNSGVVCLEKNEEGNFTIIWSIFPFLTD